MSGVLLYRLLCCRVPVINGPRPRQHCLLLLVMQLSQIHCCCCCIYKYNHIIIIIIIYITDPTRPH